MQQHEAERLRALRHLRLLDTAPSEGFDRITRMAAQIFDLPISAISLTDHDRQWFKSKVGVEHDAIPRDKAPCAQVAETTKVVVIPSFLDDAGYADSLLASSGIRFYAGAPLVTRDGHGLGALCVLGTEPRSATSQELGALCDLAAMVMSQIELQQAYGRIDPVSQLANRHQFLEDLEDLHLDQTSGQRLVVVIDIGRMDQVSGLTEAHGAMAIDALLANAARRLEEMLGPDRNLYQVGATQFAFLAPIDVAQEGYLADLVGHLRELRAGAASRFVMTPAFGVAPFLPGQTSADDVLRMAYSAVRIAHTRDDGVSFYSTVSDAKHSRRHALLEDFGRALQSSDELRLVFQPRIDLTTGACIGAEALLRWDHPELGSISPGEFIPIVERSGHAGPLTQWVLTAALAQLSRWNEHGLDIEVSVNVTTTNLEDPEFAPAVAAQLRKHAVRPSALEIEIAEGTMMGNVPGAMRTLHALRDQGVRVALDDFGTGYSSLAYLRRLPIDIVKIDQSFVRNMATEEKDRKLVRSIVDLSQDLGYRVVAEGVETEGDRAYLVGMGCDEAQGYLFAKPMEAAEFARWLERRMPFETHPTNGLFP